jgi:2'-5' RNA ligase
MEKVYYTAVVIIPTEEFWGPIQNIRKQYDKQFKRWMPHITMLYPFHPRNRFDSYFKLFGQALKNFQSFELKLKEFRYFHHGKQSYAIWLNPEPKHKVIELQEMLLSQAPDCNDINKFKGGFTPHLSVGQVKGKSKFNSLLNELQENWNPITFSADKIALIWRNKENPKDPFKIIKEVGLKKRNE